jgi:hypothetical protein
MEKWLSGIRLESSLLLKMCFTFVTHLMLFHFLRQICNSSYILHLNEQTTKQTKGQAVRRQVSLCSYRRYLEYVCAPTDGTSSTFVLLQTIRLSLHTELQLTPWRRGLLEKLTVSQLVKKFPAFYVTRRFITAFTTTRHLSLSWASSIQSRSWGRNKESVQVRGLSICFVT